MGYNDAIRLRGSPSKAHGTENFTGPFFIHSGAIGSVYHMGRRDTPMHTVNMPDKSKRTRITLVAVDPWKVRRGHAAHRGGAGTHGDRRTKRLRSRGDQRRVALAEA